MGCASSSVAINTQPEGAKAYLQPLSSEKKFDLGATPINKTLDDVPEDVSKAGPTYLIVEKDGFLTEKILITEVGTTDLTVTMNLKKPEITKAEKLNALMDSVFRIQRLIKVKKYDEAKARINAVKLTYYDWQSLMSLRALFT